MDEKQQKKRLRRHLGSTGWTLLIYFGIMNVCVMLVLIVDMIFRMLRDPEMLFGGTFDDSVMTELMGNGWGYFIAAAIGLVIMLIWKGKKFCFREIWITDKTMTCKDFFSLLFIFVSGQLVFQLFASLLEALLNLLGLSAMSAIEAASFATDTLSMFLYAGILAPITEEILFRGLLMRTLQPFGKKFAILASAFLFGIFHGNLVQSPFAFAVGLVLGYTAMEYSILWAMVLHMFNNLLLSDVMNRLTSGLSEEVATIINLAVILALSAAGIVVAIVRRKEISQYLNREKMNGICLKCFFSSAGIIVLMAVMVLNMILGISAYSA